MKSEFKICELSEGVDKKTAEEAKKKLDEAGAKSELK